jgi:hypothetical protein
MKHFAIAFCLMALMWALSSCAGLWLDAYRHRGGGYERQRPSNPTPQEAAANVLPRPGSSQPTHL